MSEVAVDTSVVIAVALGEPEAEHFLRVLESFQRRVISAFSVMECSAVLQAKFGASADAKLTPLLVALDIEVVALTSAQAGLGRSALTRYGKGRHPAGLNLGDCCSYALATERGTPLLFKGNDFSQTDVQVARTRK